MPEELHAIPLNEAFSVGWLVYHRGDRLVALVFQNEHGLFIYRHTRDFDHVAILMSIKNRGVKTLPATFYLYDLMLTLSSDSV